MSVMDFASYQEAARRTANCPVGYSIVYPAMGLAGEAGELANKVKKIMRGDSDHAALVESIKAEMGDILWYLATLADDLDADLGDIAKANIAKLADRQARGQLKGDGDTR